MIVPGSANPLLFSADEGYNLTRSLRLRASASAYLSRTPASATNRRTWTLSCWIKRGALSFQGIFTGKLTKDDTSSFYYASDKLSFLDRPANVTNISLSTDAVYRDPSAWYHVVLVADTTNATSTDRIRIYVNNTRQTLSGTYPSQNYEIAYINNTTLQAFGVFQDSVGYYFDGYMTEVNFIDGQALTPSSFGETDLTTGVWKPKRYAGTYGTNGFYLPFTDNSALTTSSNVGLGKDFSGNNNYWTTNNISITSGVTYDSMTDVPTLTSATAANFAVVNPLQSYYTPTNGNLTFSTGANSTGLGFSSIGLGTGIKFYFEATATGSAQQIGIFSSNQALTPTGSKRYWYLESGGLYNDGTLLQSVATFTSGDTIAVAWDGTAQTVTFYKNNTQQGTAISVDTSYSYFFGVGAYNGGWNVNFGQRPFAYTPPTGYVSLNTYNLPTATIVKGNTVMDATTYTGNGTTTGNTQVITNAAGFKPDLVWIKSRSNSQWHVLVDSVRGANKTIYSNDTFQEESLSNVMNSFNSNGFTAAYNSAYSSVITNANGATYVGWQWQAGQGTTSTNTSGSITSSVSVNASAGFSVVTWTCNGSSNQSIGHGLGVAPSMVIVKDRDQGSGYNWGVWFKGFSADEYLQLNNTNAKASYSTLWWQVPDSSKFYVGTTGTNVNSTTDRMVAYCWTPIAGYSAFGSYTGNSSADGPFVYLGFKPRWIMIKRADTTGVWLVYDTSRVGYNQANNYLLPNQSDAEGSGDNYPDILSNGFKPRVANQSINTSGGTYIYAAFAENPFKNSLAR